MVEEFTGTSPEELREHWGYQATGTPAIILGKIDGGSRAAIYDRALQVTNAPHRLIYDALAIYHKVCAPKGCNSDGAVAASWHIFGESRAILEAHEDLELLVVQALVKIKAPAKNATRK